MITACWFSISSLSLFRFIGVEREHAEDILFVESRFDAKMSRASANLIVDTDTMNTIAKKEPISLTPIYVSYLSLDNKASTNDQ
mmetsp:Transcript_14519/g.27314  ORF Transcript_14519/g.27314 Transcript_14519/m.27314 type:complete len:84 (-) Transcript_14519:143-394(-)